MYLLDTNVVSELPRDFERFDVPVLNPFTLC